MQQRFLQHLGNSFSISNTCVLCAFLRSSCGLNARTLLPAGECFSSFKVMYYCWHCRGCYRAGAVGRLNRGQTAVHCTKGL